MSKDIKKPLYQMIDGVRIPACFSPKCFREVLNYTPKPNDVFIVTYPKCGTTWMQNIVMYIFRKGQAMDHPHDFLKLCPFLDMMGTEGISKMPRPGAFKTHIPFTHVPYSPESKYIFVTRNPKDCCVSFYYHTKNDLSYGYWDAEFDDFFELFISGETEDNDYFDHLLSWYPRRNDPNVFYTKYEDMKKDTKSLVIKLATFLGKEYIDAIDQDNSVLNNILNLSSFEYMKKHLSNIYDIQPDSPLINDYEGIRYVSEFMKTLEFPKEAPKLEFIRKGIVGDWKNHFSETQSKRIKEKFLEKTKGTEIQQWYTLE